MPNDGPGPGVGCTRTTTRAPHPAFPSHPLLRPVLHGGGGGGYYCSASSARKTAAMAVASSRAEGEARPAPPPFL